jgi:hypothetical protein
MFDHPTFSMWVYFDLITIIVFQVFATENYVIFVIDQLELFPITGIMHFADIRQPTYASHRQKHHNES